MKQMAWNKKSEFLQQESNLRLGSTRIFLPSSLCRVTNKKNRFSCITRLKIHHQLESHRTELFSTKLHWEIFCCISSYDYNSKQRLSHVTAPESKMADRDVTM